MKVRRDACSALTRQLNELDDALKDVKLVMAENANHFKACVDCANSPLTHAANSFARALL